MKIIRDIFFCFLCVNVLLYLGTLVGCRSGEKEMQGQEYNAVLENNQFLADLANYNIMLIAPGSGVSFEKIQSLKDISTINIQVPENALTESIAFHANSDDARFEMLKQALENDSKNTILWSLRGGYGAARLIDKLAKIPQPKSPKIVIGFSDMTALHLFLSQKWGWKTIHGAMLVDLLKANKDPQNFQKIGELLTNSKGLTKPDLKIEINHLRPLNDPAKKLNKVNGLLSGGNLTIVQTSIGTDWEINTKDKILFLEDEGEKGYRIDRTLNQLKQAGLLKKVKAIIFGDFTAGDDFVQLALQRFANETSIPVFQTDEFGHGSKNYPLIYNANSTIEREGLRNPPLSRGGEQANKLSSYSTTKNPPAEQEVLQKAKEADQYNLIMQLD